MSHSKEAFPDRSWRTPPSAARSRRRIPQPCPKAWPSVARCSTTAHSSAARMKTCSRTRSGSIRRTTVCRFGTSSTRPVVLEQQQRLAQRRQRHRQLAHQHALVEHRAGRQRAGDDLLLQPVVDICSFADFSRLTMCLFMGGISRRGADTPLARRPPRLRPGRLPYAGQFREWAPVPRQPGLTEPIYRYIGPLYQPQMGRRCGMKAAEDRGGRTLRRARRRRSRCRAGRGSARRPPRRALRQRPQYLQRLEYAGAAAADPRPRDRRGDRGGGAGRAGGLCAGSAGHRRALYELRGLRLVPQGPRQRLPLEPDARRAAGGRGL